MVIRVEVAEGFFLCVGLSWSVNVKIKESH